MVLIVTSQCKFITFDEQEFLAILCESLAYCCDSQDQIFFSPQPFIGNRIVTGGRGVHFSLKISNIRKFI